MQHNASPRWPVVATAVPGQRQSTAIPKAAATLAPATASSMRDPAGADRGAGRLPVKAARPREETVVVRRPAFVAAGECHRVKHAAAQLRQCGRAAVRGFARGRVMQHVALRTNRSRPALRGLGPEIAPNASAVRVCCCARHVGDRIVRRCCRSQGSSASAGSAAAQQPRAFAAADGSSTLLRIRRSR